MTIDQGLSALFWYKINFFFFILKISGGAKSKIASNQAHHKIRLARTISREPEVKESSVDDDDDGQVSAV